MLNKTLPNNLRDFIWHFLKQHPFCLITFFMASMFGAIEISLAPYVLKIIIDTASKTAQHPELFYGAVLVPALIYALIPLVHNLVFRAYFYAHLTLFPTLRTNVVTQMFNYLSLQSSNYFQKNFSGSLANKISDMPQGIEAIVGILNGMVISRIVAVCIASTILWIISPLFTGILITWVLIFLSNGYRMAKHVEQYSIVFSESNSAVNGQVVDSVSNIASAKIFANTQHESQRINQFLNDLADRDRTLQWYFIKLNFVQGLFHFAFIAAMLSGVIYGRMHGWITLGDFAFILTVSVAISTDVYAILEAMQKISKEMGKCQQSLSVIISPIDIQDRPGAPPINITKGAIEFKNVGFSYGSGKALFQDLSLSVPSGQKMGLVGFSGGGKSSLINLLLRLYDISSGKILIDRQDIQSVTLESLRKNIAYIPQDPGMFNRSILDNIRYGNRDATDAEVIEASKRAYCHEFIIQMPEGYQSVIGERGVKLSGGQKQRIAIARAVLKNAPILILDEATSALDSVTEKYIQHSLHDIMSNKTVIAIAHRLSTLSEMDRILFLQEGRIIEDGTINELQHQNGYFAKLWNMQTEGFLPVAFSEVFLKPARFFKTPTDVVESLEFSDKDKVLILRTWLFDIRLQTVSAEEKLSSMRDEEILKEIELALIQLGYQNLL